MAHSTSTGLRRSRRIAKTVESSGSSDGPTSISTPPPRTPTRSTSEFKASNDKIRQQMDIDSTPASRGAAVVSAFVDPFTGNRDDAKYYRENYKAYIRKDLDRSRVFIHVEDYLRVVFNISADYMQSAEFDILSEAITTDKSFKLVFDAYLDLCDNVRSEKHLYSPLVDVYNTALEILDAKDPFKIHSQDRIRFLKNDPKRLKYGVYTSGVSPDITTAHQSLARTPGGRLSTPKIVGAALFSHLAEIKAKLYNLFVGDKANYRILKDGKDPIEFNAELPSSDEKENEKGREDDEDEDENVSETEDEDAVTGISPVVSINGKRVRSNEVSASSKARRTADDKDVTHVRPSELSPKRSPRKLSDTQIQLASYAMEVLSSTPLRSHFTLTVLDRQRFQFHFYDSSSILVSSIIDISTPRGRTYFVAFIIGLRRLTTLERGFRNIVDGSDRFFRNRGFFTQQLKHDGTRKWYNLLRGMVIETGAGRYVMDDILFRQAGIIGRLTYVVRAYKENDPEKQFVIIKISCPDASRRSEKDLLDLAKKAAEEDANAHWVLNHLPNIIHSEDQTILPGSVQDRVATFLNAAEYVKGESFSYQYRVLRIVIMEELFPLDTLATAPEYAQVFLDILMCHHWLHESPGILHRDISMSNIMYRRGADGQLYGVLNDFDLSSLLVDLESRTATSISRTGTPPFMACDILMSDCRPLYRHDLESLFYAVLILATRHALLPLPQPQIKPEPELASAYPRKYLVKSSKRGFDEWFDSFLEWPTLGEKKTYFITNARPAGNPDHLVSTSFTGFIPWLTSLRKILRDGFGAENAHYDQGGVASSFAHDTLGGNVHYSAFLQPMCRFEDIPLTLRTEVATQITE